MAAPVLTEPQRLPSQLPLDLADFSGRAATARAAAGPGLRAGPGPATDRRHLRRTRDWQDLAGGPARPPGAGVLPGRADLPGHARRHRAPRPGRRAARSAAEPGHPRLRGPGRSGSALGGAAVGAGQPAGADRPRRRRGGEPGGAADARYRRVGGRRHQPQPADGPGRCGAASRSTPSTTARRPSCSSGWPGKGRVDSDSAAAEEILAACGNLPLAIRIVASRLAQRPDLSASRAGPPVAGRDPPAGRAEHRRTGRPDQRRPELRLAQRGGCAALPADRPFRGRRCSPPGRWSQSPARQRYGAAWTG